MRSTVSEPHRAPRGESSIPRRRRLERIATLALAVFLAAPPARAADWTITDLGVLPGGTGSAPYGISDQGQVVGASYVSNRSRAFLWTSGGGMLDLGTLAGMDDSIARGINDSGQVVGEGQTSAGWRALMWTSGTGGVQNLGTLPGGTESAAYGINDAGQVVGGSNSSNGHRAFLWSGGGMQSLGVLPGGSGSAAFAINGSGQVTGTSIDNLTAAGQRAFLWTESGMQDLGNLPGGGGGTGYGINGVGQVVGDSYLSTSGWRAFLWSSGSGMQSLGTLPLALDCLARGINDRGQVVGRCRFSGGYQAFLWTSESGMQDLGTVAGVGPAGWALITADAINNAGQIVGSGIIGGVARAYLLSPATPDDPSPKTAGACPSSGQGAGADPNKPDPCPFGNPINPFTGNKYQIETDYVGAGTHPLVFERYYNSNTGVGSGRIGERWRHTFDRLVSLAGVKATVFRPDGKQFVFTQSGASWVAAPDVTDRLARTAKGWTYTTAPSDEVETYDNTGQLVSIANRAGVAQVMGYDRGGRLQLVTHSLTGQTLTLLPDPAGRIASLTDPAGKVFHYGYDAAGNLTSVTYPDDTPNPSDDPVRTYGYGEPVHTSGASLPHHLTGIVDERGRRLATYAYGADGRALSTERAGGVFRYSVAYNGDGTSTVTDPLQTPRVFGSQTLLDVPKHATVDEPCTRCGLASSMTYDTGGRLAGATNFNGVSFVYVHDGRGLETSRTEAVGTPQARTIRTRWHPFFRLPAAVAEPKRITTYRYNGDRGADCGAPGALCSRTERATADETGAQGFAATSLGAPRVWRLRYDPNGRPLSVDGPRIDVVDVDHYEYWAAKGACTVSLPGASGVGCRGQLRQVRNAAGHTTTFAEYNAQGRPLKLVDPNGLVTLLGYDARQRLASRTVGTETTRYVFDAAGQLVRLTLPDQSYVDYGYDDAHRLVAVQDNLGNRTAYTLDAMGNWTRQEIRHPGGDLRGLRKREYDALNRLVKDIGGTDPAAQTTEYDYDGQGNPILIDGPLPGPSDRTRLAHDALNRLRQVEDALAGLTGFAYDGLDQLSSVTDPRTLTTSHAVDGLGDASGESSPDRGTTGSVFDAAGNVITRTDARGRTTTFAYDARNRLRSMSFSDGTPPVSLSYDNSARSPGGRGRLHRVEDAETGSTAFRWTREGRLRARQQRSATGVTLTAVWSYGADGRKRGLTYPSGRRVTWSYDGGGRLHELSAEGLILRAQTHFPFGEAEEALWGNGRLRRREHDLDGRISKHDLDGGDRVLDYDGADRIRGFLHDAEPAANETMEYDAMGRLVAWSRGSRSRGYAYDANGNRTSLTVDDAAFTFSVAPTSNRLVSASGPGAARTFTFDASGNVVADGTRTFTHDARGRLVRAEDGALTHRYFVNALGERVAKSGSLVPSGLNHFVYDERGRLLGEYAAQGAPLREYVWWDDELVAVLKDGATYFVDTDHLGAPVRVRDAAGQIAWRWDGVPFAENGPDASPGGGAPFVLPLRLPGQYSDSEAGRHYNHFRDYDPLAGRYDQVDPIGLRGGTNPYLYAQGDPFRFVDPYGLAVYVAGHLAVNPWVASLTDPASYHLAIQLIPDNPHAFTDPSLWIPTPDGGLVATLGGQGFGHVGLTRPLGNLIFAPNYSGDDPSKTLFQQRVPPPCGMTDTEFINSLLRAARTYQNDLRYLPLPGARTNSYNSNSFVSGVLRAAGATPPALDLGPFQVPGYDDRPIPLGNNTGCQCRP